MVARIGVYSKSMIDIGANMVNVVVDATLNANVSMINTKLAFAQITKITKITNDLFLELMSDDITVSVNCAQIIYREQGFPAWVGWKNKCSGGRAPSVDHCFGPSAGSRSGGACFSSW